MKRRIIRADMHGYSPETLARAALRRDFEGASISGFGSLKDLRHYVKEVGKRIAPCRNIMVRGFVDDKYCLGFSVVRFG